jgi:ABC-type polysaccharide/polyol phosphate export permease
VRGKGSRIRPLVYRVSPMSTYAALVEYRELFRNLFRRDLHAKYRGSALGIVWTIANPVLLMGIYLLVFSVVWQAQFASGDHYALFLLAGLAPWTFFATSLQASARSMLDNANLIRKTRFPRQLVPLSVVGAHLVSFAVMLALLLVVNFAVLPRVRGTEWLAIPLAVLFVGLVAGLGLAVASLNVLFRDVEFIVAALLLPWFFLTPILYPLSGAPGSLAQHQTIVAFLHWGNPIAPGIIAIRAALFYGDVPPWGDTLYLACACLVSLALGAYVFTRADDEIAIEV